MAEQQVQHASRSHIAVIVGLAGDEKYLDKNGHEVATSKQAKRFRSAGSADQAARDHIATFEAVVQRHVSYRVEPVAAEVS